MDAREAYEKSFKAQYETVSKWIIDLENNYPEGSSKDMIEYQLDVMYNLKKILETRADTEGIKL